MKVDLPNCLIISLDKQQYDYPFQCIKLDAPPVVCSTLLECLNDMMQVKIPAVFPPVSVPCIFSIQKL